jgi:hypothetical protein
MWTEQAVQEIDSQGKDSSASTITADVTKYQYWLTKTAGSCPADSVGNSDCVGFGWMANSGDTTSAANYYDGYFTGFGTVLITTPAGDYNVQRYASTYGWGRAVTDARNYLARQLLEADLFSGPTINCTSKLISQTINVYAGEALQTLICGTNPYTTATPTSCNSTYTKSPYEACETMLLSTRSRQWEQTGTAGPWIQHDYTYDDYRSSGTSTGLGSFYASPATGSYHNTQQVVVTSSNASSNAPTGTQKWTYYTTNTGTSYIYYNVDKVAHSEVDDSSGTPSACTDSTYDEGVASGVPQPAAGWATTQKTYSTCGTSSTAITSYALYDTDGNQVASVNSVGAATPSLYSSSGCTNATPVFKSSSWTASRFTSCRSYSAANALPTETWVVDHMRMLARSKL